MSKMKDLDIKDLNEKKWLTTGYLIGWVKDTLDMFDGENDEEIGGEIIARLEELDELRIRFKYLEKKHEDLYGRLSTFAEKLGDSLA